MTITVADIRDKAELLTGPGGMFEITEQELDGRRYRAYAAAAPTLADVLQGARVFGDAEFIVYGERRLTYAQFFFEVDALSAALRQQFGVVKGDRVAIAMRNCPEWMVAMTAIVLVGAVAVPVNSWGKTEDLDFVLTDSQPRVAVMDPERYALVADRLGRIGTSLLVTEDAPLPDLAGVYRFADVLASYAGSPPADVVIAPEDYVVILYTSGSTGFPKGVLHRHVGVCQALMNMFFTGMLQIMLEGPRTPGTAASEASLVTVPLFHSTGLMSGLILPAQMGQKVVLMYKWDCVKALQLIEAEKITMVSSVPAILKDLLNHPDFERYDTSTVSRVSIGGAATPADLPELIERRLGRRQSRAAGYGMTETMAVGCSMSGGVFDLKPMSVGPISPIMGMRFADPEGVEVPPGAQGEIQVSGIACMVGYWNRPEVNAQTFTADGWLRTGDLGRIDDDGFVHITGRIKEIVIRGGENIYPAEVESAAYRNPVVQEAVMFGVEDDAMGEELVLLCYLRAGAVLTPEALREELGQRLARYKVPRHIVISHEPLPRNASEKLHRIRTRELYLAGAYAA